MSFVQTEVSFPLPSKNCQRLWSGWTVGLGESPFSVLEPALFVGPPGSRMQEGKINLAQERVHRWRSWGESSRYLLWGTRKAGWFPREKGKGSQEDSSSPEVPGHGTRARVDSYRVNFLPWFRQSPSSPSCLCSSREKAPLHPSWVYHGIPEYQSLEQLIYHLIQPLQGKDFLTLSRTATPQLGREEIITKMTMEQRN